jgi:hypothetical protein
MPRWFGNRFKRLLCQGGDFVSEALSLLISRAGSNNEPTQGQKRALDGAPSHCPIDI